MLVGLVLLAGPGLAQRPPFLPTLTPTRTPTVRPVATATPIPMQPTATPRPAITPQPTATSSVPVVTLVLATVVMGVQITGPSPTRYEVQAGGQWFPLTPRTGCWTTTGGACVGLEPTALVRLTFPGGGIREQRLRLSQPRIQLAQAAGPVALVSFTTPQAQP